MAFVDFFDHKEVEWADLSVAISGATMGKVRGLTVEAEIELEHLFAAGNQAISIQAGNERISFTLKVLKQALDDLWTAATASGAASPLYIEFDIMGTFKASGSRPLKTLVIGSCRMSKYTYSMMQGDKFMEIELPGLALTFKVV